MHTRCRTESPIPQTAHGHAHLWPTQDAGCDKSERYRGAERMSTLRSIVMGGLLRGLNLRMALGFLALQFVLAVDASTEGCAFHCSTSPCGGNISIRPRLVKIGMGAGERNATGGFVGEGPSQSGLYGNGAYRRIQAVDLSNRGITSFQPNAFECWDGQWNSPPQWLRGVILDNNPFGALPSLTVLPPAWHVSFNNCSISSISSQEWEEIPGGSIT